MKNKNKQAPRPAQADPKPTKRSPLLSEDTDPEGSYTGVCPDPDRVPTQDADDL